jgi:hypothetical protein
MKMSDFSRTLLMQISAMIKKVLDNRKVAIAEDMLQV